MLHISNTISPSYVRLLLALAGTFSFNVWSDNVRQAYPQDFEPLGRDIYLRDTGAEFDLKSNQCIKILRPLYGLYDAGNLWRNTLHEHHRIHIGMKARKVDPMIYYLIERKILVEVGGTYVDEIIRAGDKRFKEHTTLTKDLFNFEMAEESHLPFEFTGFSLSRNEGGDLTIDQHHYLRKL